MNSRNTINFRIHHCRRDLNDASVHIKRYLSENSYDALRATISVAERLFAESAIDYPPFADFNMPEQYFDGIWNDLGIKATLPEKEKAMLKVKEGIEKADRRAERYLKEYKFIKQRESLEEILDAMAAL